MTSPIAGDLLATITVAGATIPAYTIPVPTIEAVLTTPVSVVAGGTYAIVASAPDAAGADGSTGIGWRFWSFTPVYTAGTSYSSADSGAIWTPSAGTQDFHFITKAGAVEKDKPSLAGGSASVYLGNTTWKAQTFTAASTYSLTSLVLEMHKGAAVDAGDLTIALYGYVFTPPVSGPPHRRLVAAAQDRFWYEDM